MTRANGKTNPRGAYSVRGFKGNYSITVTTDGKSKTITSPLGRWQTATGANAMNFRNHFQRLTIAAGVLLLSVATGPTTSCAKGTA
jgi:hypothetical protein